MKRRCILITAAATAFLTTACGGPSISGDAWTALRDAKTVEIVSLEPNAPMTATPSMLYYWNVLGKATVGKKDTETLIEALEDSIADEAIAAGCFQPRHALVATHNGHKYEVLICFSCGSIRWYLDGKQQDTVFIGDAGESTFNKVFTAAGLPIAP